MFERFTKEARRAVTDAESEARALGSATVGAEHLLLAVSEQVQLDRETIVEALAEERRVSLAAVGVTFEPPQAAPARSRPRFSTSAKLALSRALRFAAERGDRRLGAAHVALGVLDAEVGIVPRALAIAGIDRAELRAEL